MNIKQHALRLSFQVESIHWLFIVSLELVKEVTMFLCYLSLYSYRFILDSTNY